MRLDKRLIRMLGQDRFALTLTILFGLLSALLIVGQARILSTIIDSVFLQGLTLQGVLPLFWLWLGVIIMRSLAVFGGDFSSTALAVKIKTSLREQLVRQLFKLGPAYAQGEKSGELVATVTKGIEALDAYFSQYLPQLVLAALIPSIILVTVFPVDILTVVIMVITLPLIPAFMILIGKNAESLTRRQWVTLGRLSARFLDTLQGLTTLKELNQSQIQTEKLTVTSERYRQVTMGVLRITFLSALVLELISTISTAVIAVEIGLRLLYGRMIFADALFILVIAPEFYFPLRSLGMKFHAGMSGVSAARRIFEVMDQTHAVPVRAIESSHRYLETPPEKSRDFSGDVGCKYRDAGLNIEFLDVHYRYPGMSSYALDGISMSIHSGEISALVGPNGAGKSTVLQLLLCFIEPTHGVIKVNGKPLSDIDLEDWLSTVSWVSQQPYLFHDTISANISLGNPNASIDSIKQAARSAYLDQFLSALPDGYDTMVGEKGLKVSGGEAQAIALSRAYLVDTPLLLLDEPTAHLDPFLEGRLQTATQQLLRSKTPQGQSKTVITIAHRLPTVSKADKIIVLERGKVIETGTHDTLKCNKGAYNRLLSSYGSFE
jgi:thiol reductant ABC exporter CydD subunit